MSQTAIPNVRQIRVLLQQALDFLNKNDLTRAEATLTQVLASAPEEPDALQLMGVLRRAQGFMPDAEDFYRRSLAVRPNQPQVHNNLGNLYRAQQRYDEAI